MVVGLLGILKAGGAYVPLDPELPAERLAFMLRDANAPVVLAQERWRELLGACSARVVWLDGDCPSPLTPTLSPRERGPLGQALVLSNQASLLNDLPAILPLPGGEGRGEGGGIVGTPDDGQSMRGFMDCTGSSSASIGPDRLAYMIYTSGSTGHPKGALNTHRGICNRLLWMQEQYELTARDAVLQKTPLSFDVSVWEVFWPLMAGARLVLAQPGGHRDPVYLAQLIASENVTVTHFVPSLLQLFLEQPGLERCQPLRLIISSGETLSPELAQRCLTALPVRLENLYGPTEAAVDVTSWTCRRGLAGRTVPIGRPVANTQIYIVDEHLQPAPCGVPGELLIGGVQVGRGYHNRPELTAERFVADPFSGEPGARMYRTGDLARWLPDGNIEFIGRRDLQVKLRGVRIELGEIDAALERHADISRAVTVLHEASGEKRLASFCVPRPGAAPTVEALRNFLRERLPEAMVPAALIFLDALPLTPSGKVDRRCLHAPAMQRPPSALASVPPYDLLEVQIQQVWEEVLGIQPVGVQDNFFDLGGHSLLAVRLFAQLEKATGHRLPLATLFQAPTVEQLGRVLRQEGWTPPWSSLVAIKPGGTRPPFYIIHGVGGNVLNFNRLAKHLGEDQPVYGLQSQGLDGRRAPVTRIEEMAAHYIKEIRSLQRTGPYHLGGMSFGGVVAFEMALQLRAHGEQVGLLALLDTFPLGYSELMPLTERSRQELALFTRRVRLHWENLASLSGRQKLDYAARKLRTIRRRIRSRLWGAAYKFFDRFGARAREHLPAVLQNVKEANFMAARDYVPKPYAGNVTLFLASDEVLADVIHPEQLWKKLALGGVEAHSIPGDHVNLIDEPHVQVLAERLRACLAVASGGHAWPN
jgi:amino acid adenylation domain-containing protein